MKYLLIILFLFVPSVARADHLPNHHLLDLSVASYLILQGTDLGTTEYALGSQRGYEANVLMAPFSNNPVAMGVIKMSVAVATSYMMLKYHQDHPKLVLVLSLAGTAFYAGVVAHNARIIK